MFIIKFSIKILALSMIGISLFAQNYSQYSGSTVNDFKAGAKFDLNTEKGKDNILKHSGNDRKLANAENLKEQALNLFEKYKEEEPTFQKAVSYSLLSDAIYSDASQVGEYKKVEDDRADFVYTTPEYNPNKGNEQSGGGTLAPISAHEVLVEDPIGFHASAYKNKAGKIVIVFEGTSPTSIDDWKANAKHISEIPKQYEKALEFANKIISKYGKENIQQVTGHSLGGGLSQYVAGTLELQATTFNPAGLWSSTLEKAYKGLNQSNITNIIDENDIVAKTGIVIGKKIYIKSNSATFLGAHSMSNVIPEVKKRASIMNFYNSKEYQKAKASGYVDMSLFNLIKKNPSDLSGAKISTHPVKMPKTATNLNLTGTGSLVREEARIPILKPIKSKIKISKSMPIQKNYKRARVNIKNSKISSKTSIGKGAIVKNSNLGNQIKGKNINIKNSRLITKTTISGGARVNNTNLGTKITGKNVNITNSKIYTKTRITGGSTIKNSNLGTKLSGRIRNVNSSSNVKISRGTKIKNSNLGVSVE